MLQTYNKYLTINYLLRNQQPKAAQGSREPPNGADVAEGGRFH